MDKTEFVQHCLIRQMPKTEEFARAVERAEWMWAELEKRGYGLQIQPSPKIISESQTQRTEAPRQPGTWIGPYFHSAAYQPFRGKKSEKTEMDIHRDLAHYERTYQKSPSHEWLAAINDCKEKLGMEPYIVAIQNASARTDSVVTSTEFGTKSSKTTRGGNA